MTNLDEEILRKNANKEYERKLINVAQEECATSINRVPKQLENLFILLNDKNQEENYILNEVENKLSDLEISLRPLLGVTVYEKLKVPEKDVKPDSELPIIIRGMLEQINCVDSQLYRLNDIVNIIQNLTNQITKTI